MTTQSSSHLDPENAARWGAMTRLWCDVTDFACVLLYNSSLGRLCLNLRTCSLCWSWWLYVRRFLSHPLCDHVNHNGQVMGIEIWDCTRWRRSELENMVLVNCTWIFQHFVGDLCGEITILFVKSCLSDCIVFPYEIKFVHMRASLIVRRNGVPTSVNQSEISVWASSEYKPFTNYTEDDQWSTMCQIQLTSLPRLMRPASGPHIFPRELTLIIIAWGFVAYCSENM